MAKSSKDLKQKAGGRTAQRQKVDMERQSECQDHDIQQSFRDSQGPLDDFPDIDGH